ncbi:MAG: hypothetical protein V4456_10700 [Bacteroidota bacterium]
MKTLKQILGVLLLAIVVTSCKKEGNGPQGSATLEEFTIDGTATSSYWVVPNYAYPAPENDQAKAFVSLGDKRVYNYPQALTDQSKIDMVLGTTFYRQPGTPDQYTEGSVGLHISSMASGWAFGTNTNGREITDFTHRKSFHITHTQKSYANINTLKDLDAAIAEIKDDNWGEADAFKDKYGNEVLINTLVFKTEEGKRGIMKLNSYDSNKPFIYSISIKMEK